MKKDNRYNKKYLGNVVFVLIMGLTVAMCALISVDSKEEAFADTISGVNVSVSINTPKIYFNDGKIERGDLSVDKYKVSIEDDVLTLEGTSPLSGKMQEGDDAKTYKAKLVNVELSDTNVNPKIYGNLEKEANIDNKNKKLEFGLSGLEIITDTSAIPSKYKFLKEGEFNPDSSIRLSKRDSNTIDKAVVGDILDYVYTKNIDGLKENIDTIMKSNHKLSILVNAKKITSVSSSDKDILKRKARSFNDDDDDADLDENNFFDISVYIVDEDSPKKNLKISDIGDNSISFSYQVPSSIQKSSSSSTSSSSSENVKYVYTIVKKRYYTIVRNHNGVGEGVNLDYTTDTTLDFDLSKFSTYAVAYYDKSSTSTSSSSSSSSTRSSGGSSSVARGSSSVSRTGAGTAGTGAAGTGAASGGGTTGSKAPKTGDEFNAKLWIYFLVIGIVVALCSFILFQDTKDYYDEKKESNP